MPTEYECQNKACPLGSREDPGRFTGGATEEYLTTVLGITAPKHHGEGVCPNCGEKAKRIGTFKSATGSGSKNGGGN